MLGYSSILICKADLQSGALVSNSRHGGQATLQAAGVVSSISQAVHVILHLPCPSHQILQTAQVSRQVAVGIQQQHLDAQVEAQQMKERKKTAQHLTLLICSRRQASEAKQHPVLGAENHF